MAESSSDSVRVELAFEGGQIMSAIVTTKGADELERQLSSGGQGTYALDASDGRYTVMLQRVVYLKRFARESRVGFGL